MRRLARHPLASSFIVLALGLAGGATGGAVAFFDALTRRTLAVDAPERLVMVAPRRGDALLGLSDATLERLAASTPLVERLCGYGRGAAVVTVAGRESRRSLEGFTASCAGVLGVHPARGRWLEADDEPAGGPAAPVVVLSDALWRGAFGADPAAVGRVLHVEGRALTIVGVLPPDFHGLHADQGPDLIVPRALMANLLGLAGPLPSLLAIGRLAPGVPFAAVEADLRARWPAIWAATAPAPPGAPPPDAARAAALDVQSAGRGWSDLRTQYGRAAAVLLALTGALLIMAAATVAGLFSARATGRAHEFALLGAMGATRGRVAAQVAAEAAGLGAAAGAVAALVAAATTHVVATFIWTASVPLTLRVTPSAPLAAAIAGLTGTLVVILAIPAMTAAWRAAARGVETSAVRVSARTIPPLGLALQTSCAVALVFAALAFGRNVVDLYALDPGYRPSGLWWAPLDRRPGAATAGAEAYAADLIDRISAVPGVEAAALSASFPLMPLRALTALTPAVGPGTAEVSVAHARVAPGFFATLGAPLVEGADLGRSTRADGPADAVITRRAARLLFGDASAVGRPLTVGGRAVQVVGVVADVSPGDLRLAGLPVVFTSMTGEPALLRTPLVVVRTAPGIVPEADALAAAVRGAGRHVLGPVRPVWDHLAGQLARERVVFGLALLLAAVAVVVTGGGLFATLAHVAAGRRRDVAIRLALGAAPPAAVFAVCRPILAGVMTGLAAGVPLAWIIGRAGRPLFHRLSPFDPRVVAAVAATLLAVAGVAAAAPLAGLWRVAPARDLNAS